MFDRVVPVLPYPPPTFTVSNPAVAELAASVVALGKLIVVPLMFPVAFVAPRVYVVAAPPMFRVVAFVLNTVAVPAVLVVMSLPLTARSPDVVMLPVEPSREKLEAVISFAPRLRALTILASDRSTAVVTPPPPEEEILSPIGRILFVSALSISTNCVGSFVPVPSALIKAE